MDNPNAIKYSDLITPDDSITKLIGQLDELINVYDSAKTKIQGAAAEVVKGMQNVSGASEEQRKAIQLTTEETDKLVADYKRVFSAQLEAKQASLEYKAAKKEEETVTKLLQQINVSAEGSYNKLSAQYRLNKIRLNEMSAAQRAGTEEGRKLEAETKALYEQMKQLQEATGKHQLNVGNYADAAKDLRTELMSLTQQMAYLKANGQAGTEEYNNMAARAGQLKDAMADARGEVNALASDTAGLDSVMGAASATQGGFNAMTGILALMGANSKDATEAQKALGTAIGIVSGLTIVQNALQKESALMLGIRALQTKAATKAENLNTAAQKKNIVATGAATVAQKIFNAVAKANPYVLLAMALLTVVGALAAFALGTSSAAEEQKGLNEALAAQLDYLDQLAERSSRVSNDRIDQLKRELEVAKARNASTAETRKIEDEIYAERVKAHDKQMDIYKDQIAQEELNRIKIEQLQQSLLKLKTLKAQGYTKAQIDVDLDGRIEKVKIDEALDAIQGQLDNYGRAVQISTTLKKEGKDIETERQVQLEQRKRDAQNAAKTETEVLRAEQDKRLALIADAYKRERAVLRENAKRQIEDIKTRLRTEGNLTARARKSLNDQIALIQAQAARDLEDLRNKFAATSLAAERETEDARIELMDEGAEKQREALRVSYERRIADLQTAIATERDLSEKEIDEMYKQILLLGEQYRKDMKKLEDEITLDQLNAEESRLQLRLDATREGTQEEIDLQIALLNQQRKIALAENAKLAEDVRQSEADINAKYDAKVMQTTTELTKKRALAILGAQQELSATEFDLLDRNERQKTIFQLAQEKARLKKILELDKTAAVRMTDEQRQAIENTIAAIDKEVARLPFDNFYELLGLNVSADQQSALDAAISSVKDSLSSLADSWASAADAAVSSADKQVDAAQKILDAEIEARNNGYANEVETAQKELALAQKNRNKALRDQERAQRAQAAIDTLETTSSLITASANIWKTFAKVPPLAIAAIATMWASFAAAKIKAAQVAKTEQYGEGTVELLEGGSHASGNDIDLGVKRDGTRRRAEGGEFFAVINKRNSRKYRSIIPDVINAFNNGTFADRYQRANATMSGLAVGMIGTDVSGLERDVAAIRRQGDEARFVDGQGNTVVRYKNLTRKIKS